MKRYLRPILIVALCVSVVVVWRSFNRAEGTLQSGDPVHISIQFTVPDQAQVRAADLHITYSESPGDTPRLYRPKRAPRLSGTALTAILAYEPGRVYVLRPESREYTFSPDSFTVRLGQNLAARSARASFSCAAMPLIPDVGQDDASTVKDTLIAGQVERGSEPEPEPEPEPKPEPGPESGPEPKPDSDIPQTMTIPPPGRTPSNDIAEGVGRAGTTEPPESPDSSQPKPPPDPAPVNPPPPTESVVTLGTSPGEAESPPPVEPLPLPDAREFPPAIAPELARVDALFREGKYNEVLAVQAIAPRSGSPDYIRERNSYLKHLEYHGGALMALGKWADAERSLRAMLGQTAANGVAQFNLMVCQYQQQDYAGLIQTYEGLITAKSTVPRDRQVEIMAKADFLRAVSYFQLCRGAEFEAARPDCQRAKNALRDFVQAYQPRANVPFVRDYLNAAKRHTQTLDEHAH